MLRLFSLVLLIRLMNGAPASIIHTTDANGRGYWTAKNKNGVLWSHPSFRPSEIHSQESGITVVCIRNNLLIVDSEGAIRSKLPISSACDPRSLIRDRHSLIYDRGVLGIAHHQSRSEGIALEKWLNETRRVVAYVFHTFKPLWDKPELMIGQPLSLQKGRLESLCILNISECLRNNWRKQGDNVLEADSWHFPVKPQIAVVEREVKTGRIRRSAVLRLTRTEARELYSNILGVESIKPVTVIWAGKSLRVQGLFGRNYVGYR